MSPPDTCTVPACDRPADGGFCCRACTADLGQQLDNLPWLLEQLNLVTAGLVQYGNPYEIAVASSDDTLPVNMTAADLTADLVIAVQTWTMLLHTENPHGPPPGRTLTDHAAWLAARTDTIRNHARGAELIDQLARICDKAVHVIDRPPERWYAGVCSATVEDGDCTQDLYAATSSGYVTCPRCRTVHDIEKRRSVLLRAAEDVLATATEAARAVVVWSDYERGETRLVRRISAWADRRRITPRGHRLERGRRRPVYRIGDILDLLAADAQTQHNGRPPEETPVLA